MATTQRIYKLVFYENTTNRWVAVSFIFLLFCAPTLSLSSESSGTSEWLMYGRTVNRTSIYPGVMDVTKIRALWNISMSAPGVGIAEGAVIKDGIVYSANGSHLLAHNLTTGERIWASNVSPSHGLLHVPAIAGDIIYLGKNIYTPNERNGTLAFNRTTGAILWEYQNVSNAGNFFGAVYNDILYTGSYNHYLYALDANNGSLRWRFDTAEVYNWEPVIAEGKVFVGTYSAPGKMYALDANNGSILWNYTSTMAPYGIPAYSSGVVYFGCEHGILALNASDGKQVWNVTLGASAAYLAVTNSTIFAATFDNVFYAVNRSSGAALWSYPVGWFSGGNPIVIGDTVLFTSADNYVYILNTTTGTQLWNRSLGINLATPLAMADNVFITGSYDYFSARNSTLFAFLIDFDAPAITASVNSSSNATNVTLQANTSELANVSYRLNNGSNVSLYNNSVGGSRIITGVEGTNNLTIYALDAVNNLNTTTTTFVVDTIAPAFTISAPSGASSTLEVAIEVSTSEAANVTYSVNGGANQSLYNMTTTASSTLVGIEGFNTVDVYAVDAAGNRNSSNTTFTVTLPEEHHSSSGGGGGTYSDDASPPAQTGAKVEKTLCSTCKLSFKTGSHSHSVRVLKLDVEHKRATIEIASTPKQYTLTEGDSLLVDTDETGVSDMNVTLAHVTRAGATVELTRIAEDLPEPVAPVVVEQEPVVAPVAEAAPEPAPEAPKEEVTPVVEAQESTPSTWLWGALAVVLLIGAGLYWKKR